MRNYVLMRLILAVSIGHEREDGVSAFYDLGEASAVERKLTRLACDSFLDADMGPNCFGEAVARKVGGLTGEGREFYKLVENPDVWRIVHGTIEAADVDASYPLLKEVCEEVVKRYVTSFIPDI